MSPASLSAARARGGERPSEWLFGEARLWESRVPGLYASCHIVTEGPSDLGDRPVMARAAGPRGAEMQGQEGKSTKSMWAVLMVTGCSVLPPHEIQGARLCTLTSHAREHAAKCKPGRI